MDSGRILFDLTSSALRYSVIVFFMISGPVVNAGTFKIDGPFEGCQVGKLYPLQNRGILECQGNFDSLQFDPIVESDGQEVIKIGGHHIDAFLHDGLVIRTSINNVFDGCEFGKEIEFTNKMVLVCSEYKYMYTFQPDVVIFLFTNRTSKITIDNEYFVGELYYSSSQVKTTPKNVNQSPDYLDNLATCLKGDYPSLCDYTLLKPDDVKRVDKQLRKLLDQLQMERKRIVAEMLQMELEEELKKQKEIERRQRLERRAQSEFSKYFPEIKAKVTNSWNPLGDRKNRQAIVDVEIGPLGEVQSVEIYRSSGSLPFDRSVTNAIRKASPLPIPEDREIFEIIKKFRFSFTEPSG